MAGSSELTLTLNTHAPGPAGPGAWVTGTREAAAGSAAAACRKDGRERIDVEKYIVERYYVVPGRFYIEAKDLDEAILKANSGEYEQGRQLFMDCVEPDVKDGLRVRHESSEVDDWTVAEERARERGYYVEENTGSDELADKIHGLAAGLEGNALERIRGAEERLMYSPGFPNRVRLAAIKRVKSIIEKDEGGAKEDSR